MKIDKLMGLVSPRLREASTCEACGEPFTCGASLAGCWCSQVKLSDAVRAELRERYQSCLCRACLERFACRDEKEDQAVSQKTL